MDYAVPRAPSAELRVRSMAFGWRAISHSLAIHFTIGDNERRSVARERGACGCLKFFGQWDPRAGSRHADVRDGSSTWVAITARSALASVSARDPRERRSLLSSGAGGRA